VSSRASTTDSTSRQAAGGYVAWLAPARYLLLTTFRRDGAPVSTPVRVVADGNRLYFRAPGSSGTSKRIQRTDWVQVARCTVLGVCRYGPTVNATARLLAGEEAGRAAATLAGRQPAWRRPLARILHRVPGWRPVHYELRLDQAAPAPGLSSPASAIAR
jgi:uncharacterized protein